MNEKKFLGYVIARGMSRVWCYNADTEEWRQNPGIATLFQTVTEAEIAISNIQKYKNTAEVRTLEGNEEYLTVGSMSWMQLENCRRDEVFLKRD